MTFEFTAPVVLDLQVEAGYMAHLVPVPAKVAAALERAGARRLEGSLSGHAFRRILHSDSSGEPCLRFGKAWLRDAGLSEGDLVEVMLRPDPDPDRIDVPDELAAALDEDPEAGILWAALTPGRRRSLAYAVTRAKKPETRARRAASLLADLVRDAG